jgi:sporulation protein YunB
VARISKELKPKLMRITTAVVVVVAIFIFCTVYFRQNIVPTVMGSAIAQVRAVGTNTVNIAATQVISEGIDYDELFKVEKDSEGNVVMIQANSPNINRIAREISNLAQANLDALGPQEIEIAFGTFTGVALLTGFGPDVIVTVNPISAANCDFVSFFVSAGINQTLHKIYIDVYAEISIVTPIDQPTINVKVEVLVCENLIVGKVPQVYLDSSLNGGSLLDLS